MFGTNCVLAPPQEKKSSDTCFMMQDSDKLNSSMTAMDTEDPS